MSRQFAMQVGSVCAAASLAFLPLGANAGDGQAVNPGREAFSLPVVVDANHHIVGSLAPMYDGFGVYFRPGGKAVTIPLSPVSRQLRYTFAPAEYVFFSEPDCQGVASFFLSAFGAGHPAVVLDREGQLLLYVADSLEEEQVTYKSYRHDGSCTMRSAGDSLYRASRPPINLSEKYALPLRLR